MLWAKPSPKVTLYRVAIQRAGNAKTGGACEITGDPDCKTALPFRRILPSQYESEFAIVSVPLLEVGEDLDNKLAVEISWERMAMTKGQLNAVQDERQQDVEKHMGYIGVALAIIQHDRLRVEQALRRTGLRDLLQPVLSDYQQIEFALRVVQDDIRKNWDEGQQSRWNMPD